MTTLTALDGEFETPAQMIDAIRPRSAQQAMDEEEEERLAEEAAASDPEVQAWMQAAAAEDAAAAYRALVGDLYGTQKAPAA